MCMCIYIYREREIGKIDTLDRQTDRQTDRDRFVTQRSYIITICLKRPGFLLPVSAMSSRLWPTEDLR